MGASQWLRDQGRGVVGALLIGVPLLFTMETWWLGWRLPAWVLVAFAAAGLALIMVLVRIAGFHADGGGRRIRDWAREFAELVVQSATAAAVVLFMLGVAQWDDPAHVLARLGLIEVVPLGLGAAIANTILSGTHTQAAEEKPFPGDVALFALGALFYSLPIGATEEMPLIAAHAGWWRLALIIVASVLVTYLALYELGFRGQAGRMQGRSRVVLVGETCMVYAAALVVAALLLAGFGQFTSEPPEVWVQETIVLGFPAAIGGAAAQVVL